MKGSCIALSSKQQGMASMLLRLCGVVFIFAHIKHYPKILVIRCKRFISAVKFHQRAFIQRGIF